MSGRWSITMFREPQEPPFDHKFRLTAPQCGCGWVARTLDAALELVDIAEFLIAHPELPIPVGSVGKHVEHVLLAAVSDIDKGERCTCGTCEAIEADRQRRADLDKGRTAT